MKTILIALLALLGATFIAPEAQARDHHNGRHYYNGGNRYYSTQVYRTYPRYYQPYRSVYYSSYNPGYYNYYPRPYYYSRPNVVLSFGF